MKTTQLLKYATYAVAACCVFAFLLALSTESVRVASADSPTKFSGPTSSQPLALSANDELLAVANPDNNTVSIFDVRPNTNQRLSEVPVGVEPNGVAMSPDGTRVYVANTVSGTVSVIAINPTFLANATVIATIPVGTEPYGVAITPSGQKVYVTNSRSNTVSVIDTLSNKVVKTISDVGPEPRGIAITNVGNGEDAQQTVFITQFLSLPIAGKTDGTDDAKAGHVTVIASATDTVTNDIALNPIADTGFKALGDALQRIAPPTATPVAADFKFTTGAYPNQLNNIAIRGNFAYVPNTGASPNGPIRFDVNTQSLLSVIDMNTKTDAGKTINMHTFVSKQTNPAKRFITQPWAMAAKHKADEAYVISAASNIMVKLKMDSAGNATVQSDPTDTTRVLEVPTGKNPKGVVINSTDTYAYVMNYVSRDITVIDLSGNVEKVIATLNSAALPAKGSPEEIVQIGKELYHTSIGEFDAAAAGEAPITGRMSNNGWGSCGSCHPSGLSDNVVWLFGTGPRRTIPQHTDFAAGAATPKALNWSGIFDEEEDFESNVRGTSGGQGILVLADGKTQDPALGNFTPASGNRNQLKVRGVNAWDAIRTYVQKGIRTPISPVSKTDPDVIAGRALFIQANCQNCHGGAQWTSSKVRYNAPPDASLVNAVQLIAELRPVGTFDAKAFNEVRATANAPLGPAGFNPPSLLGLHAFPKTFFHNGSADSLDAVMQNVAHRSAGTFGADQLQSAAQRAQLIKFILSIDGSTEPIAPRPPTAMSTVSAASYAGTTSAPESAVAAFGDKFAFELKVPGSALPETALGGTSLSLLDSAGVLRLARLFFASPGQINFEVPAGTANGQATLTVYTPSGTVASTTTEIRSVSPGVFAANGNGAGPAAATAIRVTANNTQVPVEIFKCEVAGKCTTVPIDMDAGPVFVTLYGTGIRNRSALSAVRSTLGGADVPVLFAGAQGAAGLDQINIEIPATLKGRGEVPVIVTVDGLTANTVTLNIR